MSAMLILTITSRKNAHESHIVSKNILSMRANAIIPASPAAPTRQGGMAVSRLLQVCREQAASPIGSASSRTKARRAPPVSFPMARTPHARFDCAAGCPVEATLNLIGGKWKGVILYHLLTGKVLRFNALKRMLPNITQRMLTNQLRELEHDGLVARTIYPEVPPHVEYRLTEHGQTLEPVIATLKAWGDSHVGKPPAADKADGSPD